MREDGLFWRAGAFVKMPAVFYVVAMVVMIVIIIQVKTSDIQPFIYFQF